MGHIRRWDRCAVSILHSKISTDPGLLKIRHSHRFVAVVIQILILFEILVPGLPLRLPILTEIHNETSRPQTPQVVAGYIDVRNVLYNY